VERSTRDVPVTPSNKHRRRVLIAGAGRTGRRLAERLAEHWQVTLVDLRPERLEKARSSLAAQPGSNHQGARSEVVYLPGDATSRLVLERAGARSADCLIATCGQDETNLEICQIAQQHFNIPQLASVVYEQEMLPGFNALGVQTVLVGISISTALANRIEPAVQAAESLGLGHGEVMELTISATSPALGRPLRTLNPQNWLLAAVYRQGQLIVPHGETRLREHDRVLVVGPPLLLPAIADYLRLGRAQFPAPYGPRLVVVLDKPSEPGRVAIREARALAEQTAAEGLDLLNWGQSQRWKDWTKPLAELFDISPHALPKAPFTHGAADLPAESWGCLILPEQRAGWRRRYGWRHTQLDVALAVYRKPVLVARGSAPYRQVVALVQSEQRSSGTPAPLRGLQVALGLGSALKREVCSLTVTAPDFIAGEAVATTRQEIDQAILTLAATHRMRVDRQQVKGNPIRETLARLERNDLLVVQMPRTIHPSLFRPDVGRYLALRAPCSVLVVPDE
jgi:Trk K+ transport system NAD-binding subunit/nucleotide-binding universal stress UspA family protein